jgi:hypothetical protein
MRSEVGSSEMQDVRSHSVSSPALLLPAQPERGRTAEEARFFPRRSIKAAVVLLASCTSSIAVAAPNACGVAVGGTVTCTPAGNPYPTGIQYAPIADFTLELASGVRVEPVVFEQPSVDVFSEIAGVDATVNSAQDVRIGTNFRRNTGVTVRVNGVAAINNQGTVVGRRYALFASGAAGAAVTNSGQLTGTTAGDESFGIVAQSSGGNVFVTNSGQITVENEARSIAGINTFSAAGLQTRISNSGTIRVENSGTGGASGISASVGAGSATGGGLFIDSSGSVQVTAVRSARGISVFSGGNVTIGASGPVSATGNSAFGIMIGEVPEPGGTPTGSGDVSITAANVTATSRPSALFGAGTGAGIFVSRGAGNVVISSGEVAARGTGVRGILVGTGSGNVTVDSRLVTAQALGGGIVVSTASGAVTVTSANLGTTGNQSPGITVTSGSGSVTVSSTSMSTDGTGSTGISATSGSGTVQVTAGSIATSGSSSTAVMAQGREAAVTAQNIVVSAPGGFGIDASGANRVSVNAGSVSSADRAAIQATSAGGSGSVAITGTVRSGSDDAVRLSSGTGASVSIGAGGSALGGRNAITVTSAAGTSIVNAGSVRSGTGFAVEASGGATSIANSGTIQGPLRLTANADRIENNGTINLSGASDLGAGNDVLINSFTLSAAGLLDFGAGDDLLQNSGTANVGAEIRFGTGADTLINGGNFNAAGAIGFGDGNDSLSNSGNLTLTAAVDFGTGADSLTNTGSLNASAPIDFGDGADSLQNQGMLVFGADLRFGGGSDNFVNSGTLRLTAASPSAVALDALESFTSSGTVDLGNGRSGDVLSTPGTFTGSGASRLVLDITFGSSSDQLKVGTAQGQTQIVLNRLGGSPVLGTGPVLVQASGASSSTAFTLAGGPVRSGLVEADLVYDPARFAYTLVGTPGEPLYRTTRYAGALRALPLASADAWSAQMRQDRDQESQGRGLWFQVHGLTSESRQQRTFTAFGATRQVDLDYEQDLLGAQIGLDIVAPAESGLRLGATAGYVRSDTALAGGDALELSALNAGLYGGWNSGVFYVNGLVKYETLTDAGARSPSNFDVELNGNGFSASVEAGMRFGSGSWFFEPSAALTHTDFQLDAIDVPGAQVQFGGGDWLRGKAGLRAGASLPVGGASRLGLYGSAHYVHFLSGTDETRFVSGTSSVAFDGGPRGDHVEALLGLGLGGAGRISGYIETNGRFGDEAESLGLRAGVRFRL